MHVADVLSLWMPSDDEEVYRCCYVTDAVLSFLRAPKAQIPDWGSLPPANQLASKMTAFAAGDHWAALGAMDSPPAFRKLRPKRPDGPNVWELRTWDVRLFGWFPGPSHTFVGVVPALKKDMLLADGSGEDDQAAYQLQIDAVVAWRSEHVLDEHVWKGLEDDIPLFLRR